MTQNVVIQVELYIPPIHHGNLNVVESAAYRIQNTEYRIQNTDYRLQNTDYRMGAGTRYRVAASAVFTPPPRREVKYLGEAVSYKSPKT